MKAIPTLLSLVLLVSACAIAPVPAPLPAPTTQAAPLPPVQLVGASSDSPVERSRIGRAELDQARMQLLRARGEMGAAQWALLDTKLTEAERAWAHFAKLARESGRAAEVARGAAGRAAAGRLRSLPRVGPLLALLLLLWPASTAGPESDPPPWLSAELEFEAKLQEVARAAQQVGSEIGAAPRTQPEEATRKRTGSIAKPVPAPPRVTLFKAAWVPTPGEPPWRPCTFKGSGGAGPSNQRPVADWVRCTYQCGMYQVEFYAFEKRSEDCTERRNFDRAEQLAKDLHRRTKGQ